jgi:DNA (cytosine-5)-methyltransferase 1
MRAVSLFSGAGGMDVGFKQAGVKVIWANEIDKDAANTYKYNNPESNLHVGDIKEAIAHTKSLTGFVDIVFGGPPCQGFSVAGKMDPEDERSKLIWDFLQVVEIVKPRLFIMENVKALATLHRWASVRKSIIRKSNSMGYSTFFRVLNAADFGVPQKRERVFFVGYLGNDSYYEYNFNQAIELQKTKKISLRSYLDGFPHAGTKENPITCNAKITLAARPVLRKSPYAGMIFNGMGRPLDLDSQANTLPASMGGNKTPILDEKVLRDPDAENWVVNYHKKLLAGASPNPSVKVPSHLRRLTIAEAAHIQTFPRDYVFKGGNSSIYRQIGNAVPCLLAQAVARAAMNVFFAEASEYTCSAISY